MDLLQYRAMKAQEAENNAQGSDSHAQTQPSAVEPVQPSVQATPPTEPIPPTVTTEATPQAEPIETKPEQPQVFDINGQQVTLDELQRGYLRQSDYTKKTQDIARQSRELQQAQRVLEKVKANPEIAQTLEFDPVQAERELLEAQRYDLMLQQEVDTLSSKYADFEVSEIMNFALTHQMNNLEDAYLLNKAYRNETPSLRQAVTPVVQAQPQSVDVEALKAQIRAELQAELNTSTIISSQGGGAPVTTPPIQLNEAEMRIARSFGMTPEEYAKWR
jgi:PBP1b-binding outer membrane lipoprotein LpoB